MDSQELVKTNELYNRHWWFLGKYKIVHKLIEVWSKIFPSRSCKVAFFSES